MDSQNSVRENTVSAKVSRLIKEGGKVECKKENLYLNPSMRLRYEDALDGFGGKYKIHMDCRVAVGDLSKARPSQGRCSCGRRCDAE